ncbi:MAG: M28 family peptidase [Gemmatimonadota bacterium]|nr:M28 family peptidase [Gemmatimonadota bacterium]
MRRFSAHELVLALGLALVPRPLDAQAAASGSTRAAATITAADVARRVGIIADDSMLGRDTPSRGLDLTARYVADQFRRFGLRPGGDEGGWHQRYPIRRRRFDREASRVLLAANGVEAEVRFDRTARYLQGAIPAKPITGPAVLVGGALDADAVGRMPLRDKVVVYVSDFAAPPSDRAIQVARAIRLGAPRAVLLVANLEPEAFAARIPRTMPPRTTVDLKLVSPPHVEVTEAAVSPVLRAANVDLQAVRTATTPVYREVADLRIRLELRDSVLESLTAPNTIGILEGSDSARKREYLVYSAHMDHIGITPGRADSINNGADDDASGTAGVIELAQAFSRPGARPRRSIIFLTVSGEEKGLWGSRYFSEHPTVPISQIVANLNIDMIGRNWRDTIVAIGKEHSDLGATLDRVNRAHPELRMTAIDDRWPEERFYFRSDHYNFARKGVPILFFFNGVHPDYHQVTDSPEKIDAEKEARILRLLYHLGREIGDAPERPKWNPESYREIVDDPVRPRLSP